MNNNEITGITPLPENDLIISDSVRTLMGIVMFWQPSMGSPGESWYDAWMEAVHGISPKSSETEVVEQAPVEPEKSTDEEDQSISNSP
ncbi:MAG: hypothetical protein WCG44_03330 [bacterium]